MTLTQFVTGIANAIRAKKGTSGAIPCANFASEIASIQTGTDVSDTTAVASNVDNGKIFHLSNGNRAVGTSTKVNVSDTTAAAANVDAGKTFYLSDGTKATGTLGFLDNYCVGGALGNNYVSSAWKNKHVGDTFVAPAVHILELSGQDFLDNVWTESLGGRVRQCFKTPYHAEDNVIGFYFKGNVMGSQYGRTNINLLCMPTTSEYATQLTACPISSGSGNSGLLVDKGGSGKLLTNNKSWYFQVATSVFAFDTEYATNSRLYILYIDPMGPWGSN